MDGRFRLGLLTVLVVAVLVGVLAGRSQSQTTAAPSSPTPAATLVPTAGPNHVNIVTDPSGIPPGAFSPAVLKVAVGQKITWTNRSDTTHTATADSGAFNTDVLSPGESASWTPTKPGRYLYGCYLHPNMRGEIDVR